jgi:RNA polymerase primary sigma factor
MRVEKKENGLRERRSKTVRTYLTEYTANNAVTDKDILCLASAAQCGDLSALNTLVDTHLSLVNTVARKYQNQGLSFQELCYTGNIGLIKAADRFDERKGVSFRTYAIWWIRQSISKALQEHLRISEVKYVSLTDLWVIPESFSNWEALDDTEPSRKQMYAFLETKVYEIAKLNPKAHPELFAWLPCA